MINKLKNRILSMIQAPLELNAKSSPYLKVAQRQLLNYYQCEIRSGMRWDLRETGFRNYSQFDEDGILLYIFAAIGTTNKLFVDIGSGNGINSNCANLSINLGLAWTLH